MLICPKCGRSSDEVEFIEAFCINCYPFNVKVQKEVVIKQCSRCNRMRIKGEWKEMNRKEIEEYIAGKCRGDFFSMSYDYGRGKATFFVRKGNRILKVEKDIALKINKMLCDSCAKKSSGYYEAIVQVRGEPEKAERYAALIEKELGRKTFISKIERKKEGIDFYVGSTTKVIETLSELGVKYRMTKKLVGRKKGKRVFRTTFAIRF